MLTDLRNWIAVAGLSLMGLAGLVYSAHGKTESAYYLGLGVFVAAVIVIGILVRRNLDAAEGK